MVILKGFIRCVFGHKWEMDYRQSQEGDFIEGYSPFFFYERCSRCGKKRNDSPFGEKITKMIEVTHKAGHILSNYLKEKRGTSSIEKPISGSD